MGRFIQGRVLQEGPHAVWSEDEGRTFRYDWRVVWKPRRPRLCNFLMLNPSIADEDVVDPTVAKCKQFAHIWGYDGLIVTNLFAFVSTDPQGLYSNRDIVGEYNDEAIQTAAQEAEVTVCAWGTHGSHHRRANYVLDTLLKGFDLFALEINNDGSPKHPLYVSYTVIDDDDIEYPVKNRTFIRYR